MLGELLHRFGVPLLGFTAHLMFDLNVAYHNPDLPRGAKIFAPNHPSTTDPFLALMLTHERTSILIEDKLFKVPVFGRVLEAMRHIRVVREHGRPAFEEALNRLQAGRNVTIFPEGTISPLEGGYHTARSGAARLALQTGAPVVPVGIYLDRSRIKLVETLIEDEVEVGSWYLEGPYSFTVGEPMYFKGDAQDRELVTDVSRRIMDRIAQLSYESERRTQQPQGLQIPSITRLLQLVRISPSELAIK